MGKENNKYKLTEIGKIPTDWDALKLKQFTSLNNSTIGSSTTNLSEFFYLDLSSIKQGKIDFPTEKINFENAPSRARRKLSRYNTIMATVRPNLKGFAIADFDTTDFVCSTGFALIENKNLLDAQYVYQNLFSKSISDQIENLVVGSSYPAINNSDVENLIFPYPNNENERYKIAQILTTWDNAIETLEQLIANKERAKRALMQQLLTGKKGFKKYKKVCFTDVAELKHGYQFRDYDFTESGIPVIKIGNLTCGGDLKLDNLSYVSDSKLDSFKQFLIERGDILMALSGATIGKVSYVDFPVDTMLQNYRVGSFKALNNKIDRMYLYYILQSNYVQSRVLALMNTGAQPNIGKADFDKIFFPLPEFHEQKQIASLLASRDKEIKLINEQLLHYKNQKQGLMQQLLTGKIRVKL